MEFDEIIDKRFIQFNFRVPLLKEKPVIGSGCCAAPAAFLIEETLKEFQQIDKVEVYEEDGLVKVWLSVRDNEIVELIKKEIEDLGLSVK